MQFCTTLEANILIVQGVVTNCTITNVVLGSVKVSNTLAFTGSDSTAAEAARASVATALSSSNGAADYFGTSFGDVTVSDVQSTTTTNPTGKSSASMNSIIFESWFIHCCLLSISLLLENQIPFFCSHKWSCSTWSQLGGHGRWSYNLSLDIGQCVSIVLYCCLFCP